MKREIRKQLTELEKKEYALYKRVCKLDNSINECSCFDPYKHRYDFRNIIPVEEGTILCLNCGGYIEYKEDEWS